MDKKITASMIIEILGMPSEHVKKSLEEIGEKIENTKGVKIVEKKIYEPKELETKEPLPDNKKIYTSFMDVEIEVDNVGVLMNVALTYMPSNIEIINPSEVMISNNELSEILSALMIRLHKYDEVAKKLLSERNIMIQKIKEQMTTKENKDDKKELGSD